MCMGSFRVYGPFRVCEALRVYGPFTVYGALQSVWSPLDCMKPFRVYGTLRMYGGPFRVYGVLYILWGPLEFVGSLEYIGPQSLQALQSLWGPLEFVGPFRVYGALNAFLVSLLFLVSQFTFHAVSFSTQTVRFVCRHTDGQPYNTEIRIFPKH